jgi:hypothetical protein
MKARDAKKCCKCGRGVAAAGPTFYTVQIQYFALDPRGIQRTHGLEQFFGGGQTGAVLAQVMGDDPDIAQPLGEATPPLWLCLDCGMGHINVAALAEAHAQ